MQMRKAVLGAVTIVLVLVLLLPSAMATDETMPIMEAKFGPFLIKDRTAQLAVCIPDGNRSMRDGAMTTVRFAFYEATPRGLEPLGEATKMVEPGGCDSFYLTNFNNGGKLVLASIQFLHPPEPGLPQVPIHPTGLLGTFQVYSLNEVSETDIFVQGHFEPGMQ